MNQGRVIPPMHLYDRPAGPPVAPPASTIALADDLEGALLWTGFGTGADWEVAIHENYAYSPTHSLEIRTRLTTPTAGDTVSATVVLAVPTLHVVTLSTWFLLPVVTSFGKLAFFVNFNLGAHHYSVSVYYDHATLAWYYLDAAGAPVAIPAWAGAVAALVWYQVILRFDMEAACYRTGQLAASLVSLAGVPVVDSGAGAGSYVQVTYLLTTGANASQGGYLDDIILDTV